jgi:SAM-dependent methyltransferase
LAQENGINPQEQKRIVRQGFDRLSYDYRADHTPDDHGDYAAWVRILAERLPEHSPVLDIGCGCGLPATKLLAERFDVTGIDLSEVQTRRARRLVPDARFLCGDVSTQSFPPQSFSAVVSFYAIIHIPLVEHPGLFEKIAGWLRPSGYLLATVGHDAWTGTDEAYLGVPGGRMCWSHADEATNVRWVREAGLQVHWTRFVPEGASGHTLLFAQKPPIEG